MLFGFCGRTYYDRNTAARDLALETLCEAGRGNQTKGAQDSTNANSSAGRTGLAVVVPELRHGRVLGVAVREHDVARDVVEHLGLQFSIFFVFFVFCVFVFGGKTRAGAAKTCGHPS